MAAVVATMAACGQSASAADAVLLTCNTQNQSEDCATST